jgi:serine/threonine protein kinase
MAPEIINELPYNNSIDIWSLGILLYELIHGYSPFKVLDDI